MSIGSRVAIERDLEDKYWRQDEGFQAISKPENQRTASERDVRRVGPAKVQRVMGWGAGGASCLQRGVSSGQ